MMKSVRNLAASLTFFFRNGIATNLNTGLLAYLCVGLRREDKKGSNLILGNWVSGKIRSDDDSLKGEITIY